MFIPDSKSQPVCSVLPFSWVLAQQFISLFPELDDEKIQVPLSSLLIYWVIFVLFCQNGFLVVERRSENIRRPAMIF